MGRKVWMFAGHTNTVQHCQSLVDRNEYFLAAGTVVCTYYDGKHKILEDFSSSMRLLYTLIPTLFPVFDHLECAKMEREKGRFNHI